MMLGMAIALLFFILGILIKYGKMYFLIAGYNTMSQEEKATIDIDRIATVFRNTLFVMAFFILLGSLIAHRLGNDHVQTISIILSTLLGVIFILVEVNSTKYRIKK